MPYTRNACSTAGVKDLSFITQLKKMALASYYDGQTGTGCQVRFC